MPLFAAWVHGGRPLEVSFPDATSVSLPETFLRGLVAGTDPSSPSYWGPVPGDHNQRVVEAADVALALWLFGDAAWQELSDLEHERVVAWFSNVVDCEGPDNNWHLFFVLIDRVLTALGYPGRVPRARERFERVKSFHLGDGWFKDGQTGPVDFYNAWGFHYAFSWIDRIDPDWDPIFIHDAQRQFLQTYRYLIGPEGVPILGRSVSYRMAVPSPLVLGCTDHPDLVPPGMARRALDVVWSYFVQRGAVREGAVTQGYFGADPRLLDRYSGPASPLWSLRSLVAAFALSPGAPFWQDPAAPLPVEQEDFEIPVEGPRWLVRGDHATGAVTVEVLGNPAGAAPEMVGYSLSYRMRAFAKGHGVRPGNDAAKYGARFYRSDVPFFEAAGG